MTQDEVLDIFRQCGALLEGHFILSSGLRSPIFLQKQRVFMHPDKAETLCRALAETIRTAGYGDVSQIVSPAIGGIIPGYETARHLGVPAIFAHVSGYLDELEAGLLARGLTCMRPPEPARRSGILSFEPPPRLAAAELVATLGEQRIFATMPDGLVRLAPHFPNSKDEIPRVLGALDVALGRRAANAPQPGDLS